MGLPAPSKWRIIFAVAFALSCFGFTLFVWRSFGGPTPFEAKGYQFQIQFGAEASQLSPNADVRISGVNVGKVAMVERSTKGALATVQVKPQFAPIPRDTRAMVRFKTLLGETFVSLTPGTQGSPKLADGGRLARGNVRPLQQIDRVLGVFDEPTRKRFARFLAGTSEALEGRGDELNASLGHLAPTAENVATFLELLDADRASLQGLIRDTGGVLTTVGSESDSLRELIGSGKTLFAATAAQQRGLTDTVNALPGFLRDVRDTSRELEGTARDAAPTLAALRPVVPLLSPALLEVDRLAPELRRTFTALDPVIAASRTGLPALGRILDSAKPALPVLNVAARTLIPTADYLGLYRADVIAWAARVGAATNARLPTDADRTGPDRVLRVLSPITEESLVGYENRLPSNRYNPYVAPGGLAKLASGLDAFDCRNTGNQQTVPVFGSGAPDCKVQSPIEFRGTSRSFPRLELAPDDAG